MLTKDNLDRMGGGGQIWWSDGVTLCLLKIIWIGWGDGGQIWWSDGVTLCLLKIIWIGWGERGRFGGQMG